jgi:hypothetical protein
MIEEEEPVPPDPDPSMTDEAPALSEVERDEFEERAAIMEYDGGLSRVEAESRAMAEVCVKPPYALSTPGRERTPEGSRQEIPPREEEGKGCGGFAKTFTYQEVDRGTR